MIETPTKAPPPSGPPSAPPPDARTRVTDPPPDPGGRHAHACTECGMPLHADQAACLSCGAMVEQGGGYAGIRRAAMGSATALLVLGSAVGAAVAGLPHGKDVPKKEAQAQVFSPNKAIPPATADAAPGTGADGATDLPGADTGSKPPAIAPEKPHGSDSSSLPDVPSSTGGSGGTSSGGSSGGAASSNGNDATDDKPKHEEPSTKPDKPAGPQVYATGEQPASATVFTTSGPSGASGADYTIDGNAKTRWTSKSKDRGILVTPNPGNYKSIGVITETPGWSLEIYYSNKSSPQSMDDWTFKTSTNAERRNKLDVDDAKHYLVLVADTGGKTVRVHEIQVFQ
jgi:hypothetical protein